MSDDASAYGAEDAPSEPDRHDSNDTTGQDESPDRDGVPGDKDPRELDEKHTDDPEYDRANDLISQADTL